ncbi:MAG: S24 family peptidase [Polyangia bacterium]
MQIAAAAEMDCPEFLMFGKQLFDGKPVQIPQLPQQKLIIDVIDGFEKINLEEHADHYRGIPVYESGKLAPGAGGYSFDEKPTSTMVVYRPEIQDRIKHDLRALRVKGDSMWPRIPEGAIVIVDLNDRKFVDRQIYVVRDPNSEPPTATVSRICKADQKHFKGLALVSENAEYLPEMTDLDWHELVVGRAVWMWRNLENA